MAFLEIFDFFNLHFLVTSQQVFDQPLTKIINILKM
jgi:hypothetical protein